jgi:hypothetical protein
VSVIVWEPLGESVTMIKWEALGDAMSVSWKHWSVSGSHSVILCE